MQRLSVCLLAVLVLMAPVSVLASGYGHHSAAGHEGATASASSEGDGMSAEGLMYIIGDQVRDGVRGMAHLKEIAPPLQSRSLTITHHFMVAFVDQSSGDQIETGTAALQVENPQGERTGPIPLHGMEGHFGADLILEGTGPYHFLVVLEQDDGTEHQFRFQHRAE